MDKNREIQTDRFKMHKVGKADAIKDILKERTALSLTLICPEKAHPFPFIMSPSLFAFPLRDVKVRYTFLGIFSRV